MTFSIYIKLQGWFNICMCVCVCVCVCVLLRHVQFNVTPWIVAHQAPLSMGFSRQEYWSGLPFPSPMDLLDLGITTGSPALQADSLLFEPPDIHHILWLKKKKNYHFFYIIKIPCKNSNIYLWKKIYVY